MRLRSAACKTLRVSNDVRAVQRGRIGKRLARRVYGRLTGRLAGKLFR